MSSFHLCDLDYPRTIINHIGRLVVLILCYKRFPKPEEQALEARFVTSNCTDMYEVNQVAQDTQEVNMTACGLQNDSVIQNFGGGLIYFFVVCKSEPGPFRSHIDLKVVGRLRISPSL